MKASKKLQKENLKDGAVACDATQQKTQNEYDKHIKNLPMA